MDILQVIARLVGIVAAIIGIMVGILALWKKFVPPPDSVLQHEDRIRSQLEALPNIGDRSYGLSVIIRDSKRINDYLKNNVKSRGVSAWLKEEIKGLYHDGLEIYSSPVFLKRTGTHKYELTDSKVGSDIYKGHRIGRIPFDSIVSVDAKGDDYYPMPHIFCKYERGTPFRSYGYYLIGDDDYPYYVGGWEPRYFGKWKPERFKKESIEDIT